MEKIKSLTIYIYVSNFGIYIYGNKPVDLNQYLPINSKKLGGKKYQIDEKARHLKAITKYLKMANYEKQIKGEWNQSKNETTPSSSQTGHMATDLSMIRSIGHDLHYSDHQTKV